MKSQSQIEIRNAAMEDAASLADLATQLGYPSSYRQIVDRLDVVLQSSEHLVLVACNSDRDVVGWLHVFTACRVESDPFAEIGGFVVMEPYRGQGIGRALLVATEDWVRRRNIARLRVRSRSTRIDARIFYEYHGFSMTKDQHVFDKRIDRQT